MTARADLVVRRPDGSPAAIVEVKNMQNLTPAVAAELRRNMLAHGLAAASAYFLVASQDDAYLWTPREGDATDGLPHACWPMKEIVDRYGGGLQADDRLYENVIEWIILRWLDDLSIGTAIVPTGVDKSGILREFVESVRGTSTDDASPW